ncbi:hypothetical protein GLOIN_2v1844088 [Rhizophagus clarus]|uniref:Uncharacterized protein n=1 Tax=Rhizophagus clarus TaxID=94130 RepID=A0A8H3LW80_9GLOM|nr:hypothetical protein GLOIN_2v1844088 [Rhizophagus clarus]
MVKPTKSNKIDLIKNMYLRVFNPTSSSFNQLNFIKNKNEYFQYGYDLTESIQLTFYSAYNSSYQHLFSKNSKSSDKSNLSRKTQDIEITELKQEKSNLSRKTQDIEITELVKIKETGEIATVKVIDLKAITSSKVFTTIIQSQADSITFLVKNYSVIISELDELLLKIQNNIVAFFEDEKINVNDYNVSFKSEKAQEAGTLLVDVCDFRNF